MNVQQYFTLTKINSFINVISDFVVIIKFFRDEKYPQIIVLVDV